MYSCETELSFIFLYIINVIKSKVSKCVSSYKNIKNKTNSVISKIFNNNKKHKTYKIVRNKHCTLNTYIAGSYIRQKRYRYVE
jgi:hypothetical protein